MNHLRNKILIIFISSIFVKSSLTKADWQLFVDELYSDTKDFYSKDNVILISASFVTAAVLANTKMDQKFSDFYQNDIRSTKTDALSKISKIPGNRYMFPIYLSGMLLDPFLSKEDCENSFYKWSKNSLRILVKSAPLFLVLQGSLGGSRPSQKNPHSQWKLFNNKNFVSASGHANFGAVPFLAAATMTDDLKLKGVLYFLSTLTGLSRINDNMHYLSQVVLGWSLAFIASRGLEKEKTKQYCLSLIPNIEEKSFLISLSYRI